ncbi:XkdX family protein [Alkaliphilus metalliredigens]|nr:XkdX family protein [Alkaliphilus metalliredigens]
MDYNFWKSAYKLGWAKESQIQRAFERAMITEEEKNQILDTE